jgi:hypothetical protein
MFAIINLKYFSHKIHTQFYDVSPYKISMLSPFCLTLYKKKKKKKTFYDHIEVQDLALWDTSGPLASEIRTLVMLVLLMIRNDRLQRSGDP